MMNEWISHLFINLSFFPFPIGYQSWLALHKNQEVTIFILEHVYIGIVTLPSVWWDTVIK